MITLYSTHKLKTSIKNVIGLGDVFLFIAISVSFPTVTFIVMFVFSLLFALILHGILSKKENETVPLAGYMSLFFVLIYTAHWLGFYKSLYLF